MWLPTSGNVFIKEHAQGRLLMYCVLDNKTIPIWPARIRGYDLRLYFWRNWYVLYLSSPWKQENSAIEGTWAMKWASRGYRQLHIGIIEYLAHSALCFESRWAETNKKREWQITESERGGNGVSPRERKRDVNVGTKEGENHTGDKADETSVRCSGVPADCSECPSVIFCKLV